MLNDLLLTMTNFAETVSNIIGEKRGHPIDNGKITWRNEMERLVNRSVKESFEVVIMKTTMTTTRWR